MEKTRKTFFKKCLRCGMISGFYLSNYIIKKDDKYICQDCGKETRLSKWKDSTEKDYLLQNKLLKNNYYGK